MQQIGKFVCVYMYVEKGVKRYEAFTEGLVQLLQSKTIHEFNYQIQLTAEKSVNIGLFGKKRFSKKIVCNINQSAIQQK